MERDFMDLSMKMKNVVKLESSDDDDHEKTIDAAPIRSIAMQWSFSNKSSSHPQLMSFQDEKQQPKTGFESLTSTGLVSLTTSEDCKLYPASQKNIVTEKQGGFHYTVTNYPAKHLDAHIVHRTMNNQINLGVRPSNSPIVGSTDLRNSSKLPGAPAQLTIFYNGSVCVFDNISSEKAQAIMLLAGNGPPMAAKATPPAAPVQISIPRSSFLDDIVVSQSFMSTPPRSSPVPMTPIDVTQSAGRSITINNMIPVKPVLVPSSTIAQPLRVANSLGPVAGNFVSSDNVPQFRRKSLARFLEKRKERVIIASPYADKQKSPENSKPGAISTSLSVSSSGSHPVEAIN